MKTYLLQGFVIKRRNYGEADKIVTIFTKDNGKKTLIAKNIRRIKSRRAASLELFNNITILVVKGKGLDIVGETQLNQNFCYFSQDYQKLQIAYQLVELIDKLTKEEQAHDEVYELIEKAFNYLINIDLNSRRIDEVLIRFKKRLLELLGFGCPEVETLDKIREYIESIIENKLLAHDSFSLKRD